MCNLRPILAEFVVHVAQPTSSTSDASAFGNTPTPTPPKASANIFPSWLKDRVTAQVLRYEIAGMITRNDARRISEYVDVEAAQADLTQCVANHLAIHVKLTHVSTSLLPADVDDATLRAAHQRFVRILRGLPKVVSAAFSKGEITLIMAMWLADRGVDARDMQILAENGWKGFVRDPSDTHPHSSGGITLAPV